jgi:hypothetical protein
MLHDSLLADSSKVTDACVSMSCGSGSGDCSVTFKATCPKEQKETTVVDIVADARYGAIGRTGGDQDLRLYLDTREACIANVYLEDRSGNLK